MIEDFLQSSASRDVTGREIAEIRKLLQLEEKRKGDP